MFILCIAFSSIFGSQSLDFKSIDLKIIKLYDENGVRIDTNKSKLYNFEDGWILKTEGSEVELSSQTYEIKALKNTILTIISTDPLNTSIFVVKGSVTVNTKELSSPINISTSSTSYTVTSNSNISILSSENNEVAYCTMGRIIASNQLTNQKTDIRSNTMVNFKDFGLVPKPTLFKKFQSLIDYDLYSYFVTVNNSDFRIYINDGTGIIYYPETVKDGYFNNGLEMIESSLSNYDELVKFEKIDANKIFVSYDDQIYDDEISVRLINDINYFFGAEKTFSTENLSYNFKVDLKFGAAILHLPYFMDDDYISKVISTAKSNGYLTSLLTYSWIDSHSLLVNYDPSISEEDAFTAINQIFSMAEASKLADISIDLNKVYVKIDEPELTTQVTPTAPHAKKFTTNGLDFFISTNSGLAAIQYSQTIEDYQINAALNYAINKLELDPDTYTWKIASEGVVIINYPASITEDVFIADAEFYINEYIENMLEPENLETKDKLKLEYNQTKLSQEDSVTLLKDAFQLFVKNSIDSDTLKAIIQAQTNLGIGNSLQDQLILVSDEGKSNIQINEDNNISGIQYNFIPTVYVINFTSIKDQTQIESDGTLYYYSGDLDAKNNNFYNNASQNVNTSPEDFQTEVPQEEEEPVVEIEPVLEIEPEPEPVEYNNIIFGNTINGTLTSGSANFVKPESYNVESINRALESVKEDYDMEFSFEEGDENEINLQFDKTLDSKEFIDNLFINLNSYVEELQPIERTLDIQDYQIPITVTESKAVCILPEGLAKNDIQEVFKIIKENNDLSDECSYSFVSDEKIQINYPSSLTKKQFINDFTEALDQAVSLYMQSLLPVKALEVKGVVTPPTPPEEIVEPVEETVVPEEVEEPVVEEIIEVPTTVAEVKVETIETQEEQPAASKEVKSNLNIEEKADNNFIFGIMAKTNYQINDNELDLNLRPYFSIDNLKFTFNANIPLMNKGTVLSNNLTTFNSLIDSVQTIFSYIHEINYGTKESVIYLNLSSSNEFEFGKGSFVNSINNEFNNENNRKSFITTLNTDRIDYQIFIDDISFKNYNTIGTFGGARLAFQPFSKYALEISAGAIGKLQSGNSYKLWLLGDITLPIVNNSKVQSDFTFSVVIEDLANRKTLVEGDFNLGFNNSSLFTLGFAYNNVSRLSGFFNDNSLSDRTRGITSQITQTVDLIFKSKFVLWGFSLDSSIDIPYDIVTRAIQKDSSNNSLDLWNINLGFKRTPFEFKFGYSTIGIISNVTNLVTDFSNVNAYLGELFSPATSNLFLSGEYEIGVLTIGLRVEAAQLANSNIVPSVTVYGTVDLNTGMLKK